MEDLSVLAMLTLPYEFQFQWHYWMELPMRPKALGCNEFFDIIFRIGSHIFQCHKAMFCTRSDYFKALIDDHFHESSWDSSLNVPVIDIHNVEPHVFAIIVNHVYSNIQHVSIL
jgi:ankyrin repeat/BTB/POZ domain-containing protein 1